MKAVKAFAPGNISCIFVIKKTLKAETSGSLGVGFTVNKGVFVTIKSSDKSKIYFNDRKIRIPTIKSVINKLAHKENIEVRIRSQLPLGSGFGISGACALATAYSLNKLFNLRKSKKQLAKIAHIAEVENGTGLGDVTNQFFGGFLVKSRSSFKFVAERLEIKNKKVYFRVFSPLKTDKIISSRKYRNKINKSGIKALNKINSLNKINLKNIINLSKEFSINSGLLKDKKIINLIKKIEDKNGNASMIMLGNAIFSDIEFKGSKSLIIKDIPAHII
jgi:pantoate kinase